MVSASATAGNSIIHGTERDLHHHGGETVGHDVPPHDVAVARADRAHGLHVVTLAYLEGGRAHHPHQPRDLHENEGKDHVAEPLPQHGHHGDGHEDAGKGHE